ncbi:MAG: DNA gyrase inhibitor YacG [Alphaproteobacteria bacterium]|nr:DNA gyrase inhibitor YacG [Alphaproteobacteria bacterium]
MTEPVRLRLRRPCPLCGKPSQQKYHPFCSSRCAQVDLNRWLGGTYAIPASEQDDNEIQDQTGRPFTDQGN